MKKFELLDLLKKLPGNPEITLWMPDAAGPVPGCDGDIEQAVLCDGLNGPVVILGTEIPVSEFRDASVVWEGA